VRGRAALAVNDLHRNNQFGVTKGLL